MQIIGHRGAKGLAPENTLVGIKAALKRHVDWIEFDVRSTKDDYSVVVHDATLKRLAHLRKKVRSCTLAELKELAILSGESIPTLDEVVSVIGMKAKIDIDVKEIACVREVVKEIKQQTAKGRSYDDFLVTSFYVSVLKKVQKLDRKIHIGFLQRKYFLWMWPFGFLTAFGLKLYAVGFNIQAAPNYAIKLAKRRGLFVMVWTVNHKPLVHRLEERGVDAIITDRPEEFLPAWPFLIYTSTIFSILIIAVILWLVLKK